MTSRIPLRPANTARGSGYIPRPHSQIGDPIGNFIYHNNIIQTIMPENNVQFNHTPIRRGMQHSTLSNSDVITIDKIGVYKVDFTLTIEPFPDISAIPDGHIFCITLNQQEIFFTVVGTYQPNTMTPYQLTGSSIIDIDAINTHLSIKNLSSIPVTLTATVNGIEIAGAVLNIVKLS